MTKPPPASGDPGATVIRLMEGHPLTPARFGDLGQVLGARGCSFARGCWCMAYRQVGPERPPEGVLLRDFRRANLLALAEAAERLGRPAPGLLGYGADGAPIGWVAVGPRADFGRLARSRVMAPVDGMEGTWSVPCFVVPGPLRGRGIAAALLRAAARHAAGSGAAVLEGYPVEPAPGARPPGQWLWHGARAMFDAAGFEEAARRKPGRPVMRLRLTQAT